MFLNSVSSLFLVFRGLGCFSCSGLGFKGVLGMFFVVSVGFGLLGVQVWVCWWFW